MKNKNQSGKKVYSSRNSHNHKLICLFLIISHSQSFAQQNHYSNCKDTIYSKIIIQSNLNSPFFDSKSSSYPWYIVQLEDGGFENTFGEEIDKEDTIKIEHTANCLSTHQGKHEMNFCHAKLTGDTLILEIYGGLPAYASSLLIEIVNGDLSNL